ncbi:MAG TPA: hypothetical protein VFR76_14740 [Verrucomicrobiae bacterium]|nr:hypothetical protein [Verrucomicrobiae bacterium]
MKKTILILAVTALASSLLADSKEEVTSAAKKLGEKANYSWKTTVVVPESAQFKPGPTEGQTEKDGFTYVKMTFRDNTMQAVIKGDKAAFTNQDGDWRTPAEAEGDQGPGRFVAGMVRNLKTPAVQAAEIAAGTKELKKDGDVLSSDLTEDAAKTLMRFRRGGGDGPTISNAKGSVKFWVKDGVLSKYEFKVTGKMDFNGNDIDVDRATTVEIKDVGTTKVEVPEGAKKKLS